MWSTTGKHYWSFVVLLSCTQMTFQIASQILKQFSFQMIQPHTYMSSSNIVQLHELINRDLDSLSEWFRANRLSLNISKTHYMLFGPNPVEIPETLSIKIMNKIIEHKQIVKNFGIYIDEKLDWHEHSNYQIT